MTNYDFVAHSRKDIDSAVGRVVQEGRGFFGERKYRRKDGTVLDVEVSGSVIPYQGKEAVCAVARDLTERKELEEQLRHQEVAAFRDDVLSGLITPEQARAFVISPAVRSFKRRRFEEWGIPPVGHEAKVVCTERDVDGFRWGPNFSDFVKFGFRPWIDRFVEVHVEPPGVTKSILYASYDVRVPEGLRVDERYFFESDEEDGFVRELPESVVRYPWEDRVREVKALPGSLLNKLLGLSNALAGVYGWKQEDALWFVLTGETPQVSPLELSASLLTGYNRSPRSGP